MRAHSPFGINRNRIGKFSLAPGFDNRSPTGIDDRYRGIARESDMPIRREVAATYGYNRADGRTMRRDL